MKYQAPEMRPVDPKVKRQILFAVMFGLIIGGALIFFAVWSATKRKMAEAAQEKVKIEELSVPK